MKPQSINIRSLTVLRISFAVISLAVMVVTGRTAAGPADLDLTFGGTGKVTTSISGGPPYAQDSGRSVAVQSDGKIVVAGTAFRTNGGTADFAVVRYNPNGSLDTNFNETGIVTTESTNFHGSGYGVAIQNDGRIVVVGANGLVRYLGNGSLDPEFGTNGTGIVTTFTGGFGFKSVALQSDGKIVVAGYATINFSQYSTLARYDAHGVPDFSFNGGNLLITPGFSVGAANSLAIKSDGTILVAGSSANAGTEDFALMTGPGGVAITTPIGSGSDRANTVAVQSDGKIILAGVSSNGSNNDFALVRYNADLSLVQRNF